MDIEVLWGRAFQAQRDGTTVSYLEIVNELAWCTGYARKIPEK